MDMEEELQHTSATPRKFTSQFLRDITDDFSIDRILGHGGSATVYKGVLDSGEVIAVKKHRSKLPMPDGGKQFTNECINVMMLQHPNVVRLVGYCHEISHKILPYKGKYVAAEVEERAVCFEYLQGGSLDKHLSDESSGLGWRSRYKIIKGVCEGLHYLHSGSKDTIYHLDLKPANILLDENMTPKIGDFGLSRLVDSTQTCITNEISGTYGYMPPEYIDKHEISQKFDVFSLGVVIKQIMAGCEDYSRCRDMPSQDFIDLVHNNWLKTRQATMSSHTAHEVKTCLEIALRCVESDRVKRPTITEIVDELNKIDTVKRSLIDQVTNSQSKQEFNRHSSSGAADAESVLTAVRNPGIKFADEGTSMGTEEKEHETLEQKVQIWEEDPAECYHLNLQEAASALQGVTDNKYWEVLVTTKERFIVLLSSLATISTYFLRGTLYEGILFVANIGVNRAVLGKVGCDGQIIAEQLSSVFDEGVRKGFMSHHSGDASVDVCVPNMWAVKETIIQASKTALKHQPLNREQLHARFGFFSRSVEPGDRFIILAPDVMWKYLSNEEAVAIVHRHKYEGIADRLVEAAAGKRGLNYEDAMKIRHFIVAVLYIDTEGVVKVLACINNPDGLIREREV